MEAALEALQAAAEAHTQSTGQTTTTVGDYRVVTNAHGELVSITRR